jgi:hypothetical protein
VLSMISGSHVASSVSGAAVVSNVDAMEQGIAHPEQRMEVQAVRSSPEEYCNSQAKNSPSILSRLCSSLCCIRSVSEFCTSAVPLPLPELQPASDEPMTSEGNACQVQSLSAWPERIEERIDVDRLRRVCYRKPDGESGAYMYVDGERYVLKDSRHLGRLKICQGIIKFWFYRERLSHEWHCLDSDAELFNETEKIFLATCKIVDDGFSYVAVDSLFSPAHGNAKIYDVIYPDGSFLATKPQVVELYGELAPVRLNNRGRYEVFVYNNPFNFQGIEWDGVRWVFAEHQKTRIIASVLTKTSPCNLRLYTALNTINDTELFF